MKKLFLMSFSVLMVVNVTVSAFAYDDVIVIMPAAPKAPANSDRVKADCAQIPKDEYPNTSKECFIVANANFNGTALTIVERYVGYNTAPMYFVEDLKKIQNKKFDPQAINDISTRLTNNNSSREQTMKMVVSIANKQYTAEEKASCLQSSVQCWATSGTSINEEPGY